MRQFNLQNPARWWPLQAPLPAGARGDALREVMNKKLPIDSITVGERCRSNVEEIDNLAESISAVGLLHNPAVTPEGMLIAGERRLAALRQLGWTEIPVKVISGLGDLAMLQAEQDENTCRRPLSPAASAPLG